MSLLKTSYVPTTMFSPLSSMISLTQVLCIGPTGTGKTLTIADKLTKAMPKDFIPDFIVFSAKTSSNQTQDLIDSKLDKRRKGVNGRVCVHATLGTCPTNQIQHRIDSKLGKRHKVCVCLCVCMTRLQFYFNQRLTIHHRYSVHPWAST